MHTLKIICLGLTGMVVMYTILLFFVNFLRKDKKTYYTDADKHFRKNNPEYPPQVSAPMFLMDESPVFPYSELLPPKIGDMVWWNDPDEGKCSGWYYIVAIPYLHTDENKIDYAEPFDISKTMDGSSRTSVWAYELLHTG